MNDKNESVPREASESQIEGLGALHVMSLIRHIGYESVPLAAGVPAKDLCPLDRGHVADLALLLRGYRPTDPGPCPGHTRADHYRDPRSGARCHVVPDFDRASGLQPSTQPEARAGLGDSHSYTHSRQSAHAGEDGEAHLQPSLDGHGAIRPEPDRSPAPTLTATLTAAVSPRQMVISTQILTPEAAVSEAANLGPEL
jgi:hypothetical protein